MSCVQWTGALGYSMENDLEFLSWEKHTNFVLWFFDTEWSGSVFIKAKYIY